MSTHETTILADMPERMRQATTERERADVWLLTLRLLVPLHTTYTARDIEETILAYGDSVRAEKRREEG